MPSDHAADPVAEVQASLESVEATIEELKQLITELEEQEPRSASDVSARPHAISFAELRDLAITGKGALERALPQQPKLLDNWRVPDSEEFAGPTDVLTDLTRKRTTLKYALGLLNISGKKPDTAEPRPRWRVVLGHFNFIPSTIAWIGAIGGGIGIIVVIVHWVLDLF